MSRTYEILAELAEQALLRDAAGLAALRRDRDALKAEAEALSVRIRAEQAATGREDAALLSRFVDAAEAKRRALAAELQAMAPALREAERKAQRAFGRTRALAILKKREAEAARIRRLRREG